MIDKEKFKNRSSKEDKPDVQTPVTKEEIVSEVKVVPSLYHLYQLCVWHVIKSLLVVDLANLSWSVTVFVFARWRDSFVWRLIRTMWFYQRHWKLLASMRCLWNSQRLFLCHKELFNGFSKSKFVAIEIFWNSLLIDSFLFYFSLFHEIAETF